MLSFTLAAEELGVTPGAVSRQIKVLEDFLGLQLFLRSGRDVRLTKLGEEYLAELAEAFARIRTATANVVGLPEDAPLRVSTSATFTMRWLMPRMMLFHSKHADSNLQLTMNLAPVDFQKDEVDATIKLGHKDTPHAVVRTLFQTHLIPVCSPNIVSRIGPFNTLDDLNRHTLLHSTARPENWSIWLGEVRRPDIVGAHQLRFESSSLAYQAAIDGVGVAMAQIPLILEDLRSGKLILPFPIAAQDSDNYNLIWADRTPRNRHFQPFRDWVIAEAMRARTEIDGLLLELEQRRASGQMSSDLR